MRADASGEAQNQAAAEFTRVKFTPRVCARMGSPPVAPNRTALASYATGLSVGGRDAQVVVKFLRLLMASFLFTVSVEWASTASAAEEESAQSFRSRPIDQMATAFGQARDDAALKFARKVLTEYPGNEYAQAVVDDLARRKKAKTYGKLPKITAPPQLETWVKKKDYARIIGMLDEVCAAQHSAPGGVDLHEDWRVDALIRIGEPAIPALIEVIEKDKRLTRSVHWWRFGYGGTILAVREAALTAAMSILRVRVFEAGFTGDNFSSRGSEKAAATAQALREYWEKYGKMSFDERMMVILKDPAITGERLQEAVMALAFRDDQVRFGTTVWSDAVLTRAVRTENPSIAKFSNPTVAEAMIAAMQRDLAAAEGAEANAGPTEAVRERFVALYGEALAALGDRRIAPAVLDLANKAGTRNERLALAWSAHQLGRSEELEKISNEVATGTWRIELDGPEGHLARLLEILHTSKLSTAKQALAALADPQHPQNEKIIWHCVDLRYTLVYPNYVMRILQAGLENETQTGDEHIFDGKETDRPNGSGRVSGPAPKEFLEHPERMLNRAPERVCDLAASALNSRIWTLPETDPLRKDNAERMDAVKAQVAKFSFRAATEEESEVQRIGQEIGKSWGMLPDVPPLGRPATDEDVAAGKAIFSLQGKGRLASLKLPAQAIYRDGAEENLPRGAIIVQAEIQPNGKTKYGAFVRGGIVVVEGGSLTKIRPMKAIKMERR
jgi:hypothetical protein